MSPATAEIHACVECGEVIDLTAAPAQEEKTLMLVESDDLRVTRIMLDADQELPPQRVLGDATLQCLAGSLSVNVDKCECELTAGRFLYLPAQVSHSIKAKSRSTLLLTMVIPNDRPRRKLDEVQEASEESFPASDPPAHG